MDVLNKSHDCLHLFASILRSLWSDHLDSISGVEPGVASSVQHALRLLAEERWHTRDRVSVTAAVTGLLSARQSGPQDTCNRTGSIAGHSICRVFERLTAIVEKTSFPPRVADSRSLPLRVGVRSHSGAIREPQDVLVSRHQRMVAPFCTDTPRLQVL